jgi:hypothetical protein
MPSVEVRPYLATLSTLERKRVSTEMYRAILSMHLQKSGDPNSNSQNNLR